MKGLKAAVAATALYNDVGGEDLNTAQSQDNILDVGKRCPDEGDIRYVIHNKMRINRAEGMEIAIAKGRTGRVKLLSEDFANSYLIS